MKSDVLKEAIECRSILASGNEQAAMLGFLKLFQNCSAEDRVDLVHQFSEFFEGGSHDLNETVLVAGQPAISLISQTSYVERLGLIGLAMTFRPLRLLEVGRARGGSTVLLSQAVAESGGKLVSVDPNYSGGEHFINLRLREKLSQRGVEFVDGLSPGAVETAAKMVGGDGRFDFVFIDADHAYESVVSDLLGVIPFCEPDAYIVLHDANYAGVADGIEFVVRKTGITDCGRVGRDVNASESHRMYRGRAVLWGGLHLLRVTPVKGLRRIWSRLF